MPIPSSVETLPPEIKSEIDRMLIQRIPLDRIVAHLRGLSGATSLQDADMPSRSALGRYAQKTAALRERLARSRAVAVAVAAELDDAPGSAQMTVLTELLQSAIFDLMMPEDGPTPDLDAKSISELAKSLKDITHAARSNLEFIERIKQIAVERTKRAAAASVDTTGRERGLSRETVEAIKAGIFGVKVLG